MNIKLLVNIKLFNVSKPSYIYQGKQIKLTVGRTRQTVLDGDPCVNVAPLHIT